MTLVLTGQGRPLRAASALALLLGCWGMWRLPLLEREFAALAGARGVSAYLPALASAVVAKVARASGGRFDVAQDERHRRPCTRVDDCRVELGKLAIKPIDEMRPQPAPDFALAAIQPPAPQPQPPAPPLAPTPTILPPPTPPPTPGDLAGAAYARLAAGDRRGAARLFDLSLAGAPDPRAGQWRAERRRLGRRWSGEAFSLLRDAGGPQFAGPATPVLGGGQSGATLAFAIDPLARRPVAMVARLNAATGAGDALDRRSLQAAIGMRWQVLPQISISAERLIALGADARDDWVIRLAGGAAMRRGRIEVTGYGEAGVIGNGDVFAGGQARAAALAQLGPVAVSAGAGGWASVQAAGSTTGRVDIGPTLAARLPLGAATLEIAADWRFRVAGNAGPDSGPVVTLSTRF